mmetsp:Transcript_19949/g.40642  ORF Transcript_19949/g.40642 Transcript_19949/m.40642 type:complete len:247 (+) Transcript_19949:845-1585(+)
MQGLSLRPLPSTEPLQLRPAQLDLTAQLQILVEEDGDGVFRIVCLAAPPRPLHGGGGADRAQPVRPRHARDSEPCHELLDGGAELAVLWEAVVHIPREHWLPVDISWLPRALEGGEEGWLLERCGVSVEEVDGESLEDEDGGVGARGDVLELHCCCGGGDASAAVANDGVVQGAEHVHTQVGRAVEVSSRELVGGVERAVRHPPNCVRDKHLDLDLQPMLPLRPLADQPQRRWASRDPEAVQVMLR